jgi:hypothetical protein
MDNLTLPPTIKQPEQPYGALSSCVSSSNLSNSHSCIFSQNYNLKIKVEIDAVLNIQDKIQKILGFKKYN